MKPIAPSSAPGTPRSRHAQKIASWVEAGPGSRLVAAMPSSNSSAVSHPSSVTHSRRSSRMCVGGPPKPMQPIRPHWARMVPSPTRPSTSRQHKALWLQ
jgi:hypothetical protein